MSFLTSVSKNASCLAIMINVLFRYLEVEIWNKHTGKEFIDMHTFSRSVTQNFKPLDNQDSQQF